MFTILFCLFPTIRIIDHMHSKLINLFCQYLLYRSFLFVGSDAYELVFHRLSRATITCAWKLRCKLQAQRMYAIL